MTDKHGKITTGIRISQAFEELLDETEAKQPFWADSEYGSEDISKELKRIKIR